MHDAIRLEEAGIPATVIVTTAFVHEAEVQRAALGMDAIPIAVISHPLSTLSPEQIAARAGEALPQVLRIWRGEA